MLLAGHFRKGFLVIGIAAQRLHVDRQSSLILADQLQDDLIRLWPMISAVAFNQLVQAGSSSSRS